MWVDNKSINGGMEETIDIMLPLSMYIFPRKALAVINSEFDEVYEEIINDYD